MHTSIDLRGILRKKNDHVGSADLEGTRSAMKLTIFGASGRTGKLLVEQALAAGHDVVAFVRNPAKLTTRHEQLKVVIGDVKDPAAVERAVNGTNAIIFVLNTGRDAKNSPITRG